MGPKASSFSKTNGEAAFCVMRGDPTEAIGVAIGYESQGGEDGTVVAICSERAAETELDDAMEGEIVDCPDWGVELEVVGPEPLTLDLAPEEEKDGGEQG